MCNYHVNDDKSKRGSQVMLYGSKVHAGKRLQHSEARRSVKRWTLTLETTVSDQ